MTDDQKNQWHQLMVEVDLNLNALHARLETWERVEDYMLGAIEHQRWVQEGRPEPETDDDEPDDLAEVLAAVPGCLLTGGRHD